MAQFERFASQNDEEDDLWAEDTAPQSLIAEDLQNLHMNMMFNAYFLVDRMQIKYLLPSQQDITRVFGPYHNRAEDM